MKHPETRKINLFPRQTKTTTSEARRETLFPTKLHLFALYQDFSFLHVELEKNSMKSRTYSDFKREIAFKKSFKMKHLQAAVKVPYQEKVG